MPTPEVIERVRELREHLAETQPDPALAPQLEPIQKQLDTIMLEPHDVAHYTSLGDRLVSAYVYFETAHPKVAQVMQAAINALQAAGL